MAKYSKKAGEKVKKALLEMKQGELKSGRSGKKVTDPKQAIAIGLSEAREEGAKVPQKSDSKRVAKKTHKRQTLQNTVAKKSATQIKRKAAK